MRLTIIIPSFNRAKLLTEAVQSIVSHRPVINEVVIFDDASTDETKMLCHKWQMSYSETHFVVSRGFRTEGAQVARNGGLRKATGDVVMFMDSDDVLSEDGVAPLLRQFQEHPNLDYVYGDVVKTNAALQPIEQTLPIGSQFSSEPIEVAGYHWHTMGAIYRKEYLRKVGPWNEQLTGSQDWEFQARVKLAGGTGKYIDHTVGYWRDHSADRVGTKKFRLDYVESVIKACLLIHEKAQSLGKLDKALEHRLMKKLLLHTLELSANGHSGLSKAYVKQAIDTLCFKDQFTLAIQIFALLPHQVDTVLFKTISSLLTSSA